MKKITLLFILSTALFLSCSSDDSVSTNNIEYSILGKWLLSEVDESTLDYWGECAVGNSTKEFLENSLVYTYFYGNNCQQSGNKNFVYTLSGNILTTTELNGGYENGTDYIIKYNIISLSETTLKLEEIYIHENYPNGSGYNIPQNERTEEVWTRIE